MAAAAIPRQTPSVELVIGPYRSGKTARLIEEIIAFCKERPFEGVLLIVPSARYRTLVEKRTVALLRERSGEAEAAPGIFGLRVVTFYDACRMVLKSAGARSRLVPDDVRAPLVAEVMAELAGAGQLQSLAPIAALPGTHAAVLQLIDEFQRAGLSPEAVCGKLEETAASESRYVELATVYRRYWQSLDAHGYLDRRRLAFAARSLLHEETPLPGLSFGWVAADGFDRISRLQAQVLLGLSRHCQRCTMVFDYVTDPSGEKEIEEYAWKKSSYRELVETLNPAVDERSSTRDVQQRALYVSSALDRFQEMSEVARRVKEAIVTKGRDPQALLVTARDLGPYRAALSAAFASAGVPYYLDESVALRDVPLVRHILNLLTLWRDDYSRAAVVAVLSSPYCRISRLGLTGGRARLLDELSWEAGVVGGRSQWMRLLSERKEVDLRRAVEKLCDLVTPPARMETMGRFCTWAEDVIDHLVQDSSASQARQRSDLTFRRPDDRAAMAALRLVVAGLVEEESILGARLISAEHFILRLERLVEVGNFRPARPEGRYVTICGAELAPNCTFDEIFLVGMVEGDFPRRVRTSGFVSGEELARWASYGVEIDNPRHDPAFEAALYHSLLERAQEAVHISVPRYEMSGEELVPSFFLTGGKSEAEFAPARLSPFEAARELPVSPRDALASRLWFRREVESSLLAVEPVAALWQDLAEPLLSVSLRCARRRESVYNGWLADYAETGALAVPLPDSWSASRLNRYGQCPFQFWVTDVLKTPLRDEPQPGLSAATLGSIYHRALELFYRELSSSGRRLLEVEPAERGRLLAEAVTAAARELESDWTFRAGEFWEFEKAEMLFRLRRFIECEAERAARDEEDFRPLCFEVAFGGGDGDGSGGEARPSLVVETARGPIRLRGIIDRVDVGGGGEPGPGTRLRLVDYKTGSSRIKEEDAREGRNIQLPLYALAAERALWPGSRVSRAEYLSVNSGEAVGVLDFQVSHTADLPRVVEGTVGDFVDAICRGVFPVRPSSRAVCQRCDHRRVCRIAELNPEEGEDEQAD